MKECMCGKRADTSVICSWAMLSDPKQENGSENNAVGKIGEENFCTNLWVRGGNLW